MNRHRHQTFATALLLIGISVLPVLAETVREKCQTEETRGLRFTSIQMQLAAQQTMAPYQCNGCQFSTNVYDAARAIDVRFRAEANVALLKARALEAAKCPDEADEILAGIGPLTSSQRERVAAYFTAKMTKASAELSEQKQWQREHPQCKRVHWMLSSAEDLSKEDFSGYWRQGKLGGPGWCSADGHGTVWRGTDDSLKMYDPDQNDLIGKVACADALHKEGAFDGNFYADPKFCQPK